MESLVSNHVLYVMLNPWRLGDSWIITESMKLLEITELLQASAVCNVLLTDIVHLCNSALQNHKITPSNPLPNPIKHHHNKRNIDVPVFNSNYTVNKP